VFSTTADGAASPTERLRITSDAYVRLASGTGGIQFNGDTAAANALDDYEEGTWTPVYSGTWTSTPTTGNARYTKIGKIVYLTLQLSAGGTKSSAVAGWITGLPFDSNSAAGYGGAGVGLDTSIVSQGSAVAYDSRMFLTATTIGTGAYFNMTYLVT
jgi:hypothetical protein